METTSTVLLTGVEIKRRMRARGITLDALAQAAGLTQPDVSDALNGRAIFGPKRAGKLEAGILRLGIDKEHAHEPEPLPPGVFRIRRV